MKVAGTDPIELVSKRNECASYNPIRTAGSELENMHKDMISAVSRMIASTVTMSEGTFFDTFLQGRHQAIPHIYRIDSKYEHPNLRVLVKNNALYASIGYENGFGFNLLEMMSKDVTIPGAHMTTYLWNRSSNDPYVFPKEVEICSQHDSLSCVDVLIDDGELNLCSISKWNTSGNWYFTGMQTNYPSDQCFWSLANGSGYLYRDKLSLAKHHKSKLVFSYRTYPSSSDPEQFFWVEISNNGFNNCVFEEGSGCRRIKEYYNDGDTRESGSYNRENIRTEIFDISDFDGKNNVQVRFYGNSRESWLNLYDIHVVGEKK